MLMPLDCLLRWLSSLLTVGLLGGAVTFSINVRRDRTQHLSRPDRSEIHVEFYGPDQAPILILTHG